jgi:hypothetical protein
MFGGKNEPKVSLTATGTTEDIHRVLDSHPDMTKSDLEFLSSQHLPKGPDPKFMNEVALESGGVQRTWVWTKYAEYPRLALRALSLTVPTLVWRLEVMDYPKNVTELCAGVGWSETSREPTPSELKLFPGASESIVLKRFGRRGSIVEGVFVVVDGQRIDARDEFLPYSRGRQLDSHDPYDEESINILLGNAI